MRPAIRIGNTAAVVLLLVITVACGTSSAPVTDTLSHTPDSSGSGTGTGGSSSASSPSSLGFLYVSGLTPSSPVVAAFEVNADGSLQPLAGSPHPIEAVGLASDPTQPFLFAVTQFDSASPNISSYALGGNGSLQFAGSVGGSFDATMSIDPSGSTLYATQQSGKYLVSFNIRSDGNLQRLGSITNGGGGTPLFLSDKLPGYAGVCVWRTAAPNAPFAFPPTIAGYIRHADGTLSKFDPHPPVPTNYCPNALAFSPDGKFLVAGLFLSFNSDQQSLLGIYAIKADGTLVPVPGSPYPTASHRIFDVAFDPSGKYLLLAGYGGLYVYQFKAEATPVSISQPASALTAEIDQLVFSREGNLVFAFGGNDLYVFRFTDGELTPAPGSPHVLGFTPDSLAAR